MSSSLAQDAIALLIDLAKRGEIDPWDVQVIEVIDRYLSELVPADDSDRAEREVTLSQSGQAFLYASMLVLLKADNLARSESLLDEEGVGEEEVEELEELLDPESTRLPHKLERQLKRRAVAPTPQKRRVTLPELIEQLQLMSQAMDDRPRRRTKRHANSKSTAKAVRAISELAHQENLTDIAAALEQFLESHWTQLSTECDWLELDELLERWQLWRVKTADTPKIQSEPTDNKHDRVGIFWALLLLSAQSKVELEQEEFYQDLKVKSLDRAIALEAI
ncbi:segregation/condensation protein A [Oxynema sp. CENA135]|uniref:segregation/condensation protein A n=1 Tax=Oxynema sp. CENA135 TaxID=984206 RepID=UPI00190D3BF3|nr:segregation/condensation protein A [Oxynema sp. CENA135]MBK4729251.1 segregation/condensation protein A [Oxynema sp. CENA135]